MTERGQRTKELRVQLRGWGSEAALCAGTEAGRALGLAGVAALQIATWPSGEGWRGEWAIRVLVLPVQVRLRCGQGWQNKSEGW